MLSDLCLFMLIIHVIGDFHAQTESMVKQKAMAYKGMRPHALVLFSLYLLAWVVLIVSGMRAGSAAMMVSSLYLIHLLLDLVKQVLAMLRTRMPVNCRQVLSDGVLFAVDQLLHVLVIVFIVDGIFAPQAFLLLPRHFLKWTLLLALVTKPANVAFKTLFGRYQLSAVREALPDALPEPGAGALIGNLERLLAVLFISLGQYAAVGLVFTAKSIARFRQIDENKRFAEYYLIGTLFSMLYVLAAYLLIFVLIP